MMNEVNRTVHPACALFAVLFMALGGLTLTRAADGPKTAATNTVAAEVPRLQDISAASPAPIASQDYGTEYVKQSSLLEQLKAMKRDDYERFIEALSVTSSDPILNSLLEKKLDQETKLAGLKTSKGPEAPQSKEVTAILKELKQKIETRANGIMAGMSLQATALRAAANARNPGKIYIIGPVRAPGPQDLPGTEILTLSKAILRAGGFGDSADKRNVRVTRSSTAPEGKDQVYTVNVAEILEKGKSDSDLPLESGDLIFVQERPGPILTTGSKAP